MTKINARHLLTDFLENPLGIDTRRPRLSWQLTGSTRGTIQSAYQVQAAGNLTQLTSAESLLWDSGKVVSGSTQGIQYKGPELSSRQRLCWRVRAWDQDGHASAWSEPAFWEMGYLAESDWTADWIEPDWDEDSLAFKPCPYLRRSFNLEAPPKSARLYITAHGLYEAWLNGERVGDQVFTPGYTPYDRMLQYQVYDVTHMLSPGENRIGAILGDGWYRGRIYIYGDRNVYGERLGLLALLVIESETGQQMLIPTDNRWEAATGPIIKSDMRDGETYDARLELPGWCSPGGSSAWKGVRLVNYPKNHLVASMGVPVRRKETFSPSLIKTPQGETVLDFGQNLAGVVHFKVRGPRGTTIHLQHGEALDQAGNFTVRHLFSMEPKGNKVPEFQEDFYILKGDGEEEFEPRFTVHGFRFVKVEGYPGQIDPADFYSVAIYSDMPPTGTFSCSDPLITRLHKNTEWSMKSNFLDLPTDCPQRERAGWTGDAQIFTPSASFLMDTRAFFRKWLKELVLEQRPDGMVGCFVPNPYRLLKTNSARLFGVFDGSAGWGDVAVLMPWYLYQAYGDLQILKDQYESMQAWLGYVQKRAEKVNYSKFFSLRYWTNREQRLRQKFVWDTRYHWGEWLEPGEGSLVKTASGMAKRILFGEPVVATAYYAHSAQVLAKTAGLLGKTEAAQRYQALADQVKAVYAAEFIGKDGRIRPDRQASYVRVLALDLAPQEIKPVIVDHLVRLIRKAGNHIGTGFLSTVFLCQVLADYDRLDVAYDLLTQKTIPSWLYPVTRGATTIWETWEGIREDGTPQLSLNHYSPGAVVNFLHRVVAGISAAEPGYHRIVIHPRPGGGLTSASATYDSVHGQIACAWEIDSGRMRLDVTIPANSRAIVVLPGANVAEVLENGQPLASVQDILNPFQEGKNTRLELGSGSYRFDYPLE